MSEYLNDWAANGRDEMLQDFGITPDALDGANVLVASYTYEDWSGGAYVLFERAGTLWEVHGSHCSCHGLSEETYSGGPTQWQPEETTREAILHRLDKGTWGEEGKVADAVKKALAA